MNEARNSTHEWFSIFVLVGRNSEAYCAARWPAAQYGLRPIAPYKTAYGKQSM
jgi:hypothetical protein